MIIINNKLIPLKGFHALNLFGIVLVRKEYGKLDTIGKNHEHIHTLQQREMGYIGFYLWYVVEWVIRRVKYGNRYKTYRNISFEKEAYRHEADLTYNKKRKHFNWWKELSDGGGG